MLERELPDLRAVVCCALFTLTAACGGGSSGGFAASGSLTIAITDAPVDGVDQVVVEFTGISVKPQEGPPIDFDFDEPRSIDLRALTGDKTELLLDGASLPVGPYNWLRLHVNAELDGVLDSYVRRIDDGGQYELRVPSGGASGLQLVHQFNVLAGSETAFVIDWNLRQGLVRPPGLGGAYLLQPVLRIIDLAEYGTIAGSVSPTLLTAPGCTGNMNTGFGNAVYVFPGANVIPADIDGSESDPLTVAEVRLDDLSGNWEYQAAFLPPGQYTVAFTCQAGDDRVPDPDNPGGDFSDDIEFTSGVNAAVNVGETTVVNFDFVPLAL